MRRQRACCWAGVLGQGLDTCVGGEPPAGPDWASAAPASGPACPSAPVAESMLYTYVRQPRRARVQQPLQQRRQHAVCQAGRQQNSNGPPLSPALLTRRIKDAADWCCVLELVTSYSQSFNAIHASAAVHSLSSVRPRDLQPVLQHRGWLMLLRSLEAVTAQLPPRNLSNVLLALGRLQQAPQPLMDQLLLATEAAFPRSNAQDLSNCLWALAALRMQPGERFLLAAAERFTVVVMDATPHLESDY